MSLKPAITGRYTYLVDVPADSTVRRVKLPEAIPGAPQVFFLLQVEKAFCARSPMLIPYRGEICAVFLRRWRDVVI